MRAGDIAVLMDEHVGVDDSLRSCVLSPGDSGLVISVYDENNTTALLISDVVVYVETTSIEKLEV